MLEIERKWLTPGWPPNLIPKRIINMEQSYLHVSENIEVRLRRKEILTDEEPPHDPIGYYLDIKLGNGLVRPEYSIAISENQYQDIVKDINQSPIKKRYHIYDLVGYKLEISCVDNAWFYAEIEFDSVDEAKWFVCPYGNWKEVTDDPSYAMKNYWLQRQIQKGE